MARHHSSGSCSYRGTFASAGQRLRALSKHLAHLRHRHGTDTLRTEVETKPHVSFRFEMLRRLADPGAGNNDSESGWGSSIYACTR
jgi:hypothetical protein